VDPKPNVEEVKQSLERLGIRVVNERPGRQSKKNNNTTTNRKRRKMTVEEGISSVYGIQQNFHSLVSDVIGTPPHTIATITTNQHPYADSIANIAERGTPPPPPSYNNSRTDSFMITPKEPISGIVIPSFASSDQSVSICSHHDSYNPIAAPIIKLEADSEVQGIEQVAQSDMELHSDIMYQMLEKHYLTIQDEMEKIRKLMLFHKQRLPKRKNEKLINQRVGIQTYPTIIHQVPNSPMQSYQDYKNDETELSEAEEITELKILLSDSEDNDSVTEMILREGW